MKRQFVLRRIPPREHLLHIACGLPDALLVFDEADPDEPFAMFAETEPRRDSGSATSSLYTLADDGTISFLAKPTEPSARYSSGISVQANIEAAGEGITQPALAKLSTSASRRDL